MKAFRKITAIIITAVLFSQSILPVLRPSVVLAAGEEHQKAPKNVKVSGISHTRDTGEQFVNLEWGRPDDNANESEDIYNYGDIIERGYQLSVSESSTDFVNYPPTIADIEIEDIQSAQISRDLNPGTVYYSKIKAFHRHRDLANVERTHESFASYPTTIFMTDLRVDVSTVATDAIEIKWNDVYYNGKRINYDIYISESKDFVQAPSYSIRQENISSAGPVIPVTSEKKLSYTKRGLRTGTIYYVKIKPVISDTRVKYNPESDTVVGYTKIIASMNKLASGDSGDWWRIVWNPVTSGSLTPGVQNMYKIMRGDASVTNPILEKVGEVSDTKYTVNVVPDKKYFFVIVAEVVDGYGNPLDDGSGNTGVRSAKLYPVEGEVAATPQMPELKDKITEPLTDPEGKVIYDYETELKPTQAVLAWTPPKLSDGSVDTNVVYDIWLLTDPADLGNANAVKYKDTFSIPSTDHTKLSSGEIVAFRNTFTGLASNTSYYIKIVAKKSFTVESNGLLTTKYYESEPALKTIITPTDGNIDQPVAPSKPPLRIKKLLDADGNETTDDIGKTNVRLEWKNEWTEVWNPHALNSDSALEPKWEEVTKSVYYSAYSPNVLTRDVSYDSKVKFSIGYTLYSDTIVWNDLKSESLYPYKITGISNNMNAVEQEYNVTGLQANTAYIMWIRAYRETGDLKSEPSDPLIVVTKPDTEVPIEKPIVPTFISDYVQGDTYVRVQWNCKAGYTYYLKYAKKDDITASEKNLSITATEYEKKSYFEISGLTPATDYYIWIQADSTGKMVEQGLSLWSDSLHVVTKSYIAPEIPKGFGIKNSTTAVTKNSIAYEWIQEPDYEYILEVADNLDFKNSKEYSAVRVSEYNVEALRSNYRYHARLYAYDPVKKLRSLPTASVSARTLKSKDEYDSDVDLENVIDGPFITEKDDNDVWTVSITGVNADRFIEQVRTDNELDYVLDVSDPPSYNYKTIVVVSNKVFGMLTNLKENFIISNAFCRIEIRPGVFDTEAVRNIKDKTPGFDITFTLNEGDTSGDAEAVGFDFNSDTLNLSIDALAGSEIIPITKLNKPLKLSFTYYEEGDYNPDKTSGYSFDTKTEKWLKQPTSFKYDRILKKGFAAFDVKTPGKAALMEKNDTSYGYYDIYASSAQVQINAITAKFKLNSVGNGGFRPTESITTGEAAKIIMDILGYNYGENYLPIAVKAGLVPPSEMNSTESYCLKKNLLKMVDRLYELKTGSKAAKRNAAGDDNSSITRADSMVEIYKMLKEIGEL